MADSSTFSSSADTDLDFWPTSQLDPALYQKPIYYFANDGNNTPRTAHTAHPHFDPALDAFRPSEHGANDDLSPIPMTRLASHAISTGHQPSSSQPRYLGDINRHGKRDFHHIDMEHSQSYTYGSTSTPNANFTHYPTTHVDNVHVYEPADFCSKLSSDAASKKRRVDDGRRAESELSSGPAPRASCSPMTSMITTAHLSPPPSSFTITDSEQMSRQCSLTSASSVCTDAHDMMRVESSFLSASPLYPVDSSFLSSSQQPIGKTTGSSPAVGIVDDGVDHHLLGNMGYGFVDENFSFSVPALSGQEIFRTAEMSRSHSTDSNCPSESSEIKLSQRRRKHIENARQSIAPKRLPERLPTTTAKAITVSKPESRQSATAKPTTDSGTKQAISKTPYVRPTHAKLHCEHCDDFPLGFRGEHELRRHHDRAHARLRRVWVCVDPSADPSSSTHSSSGASKGEDHAPRPTKPLSSCKQCKQRKTYNVYYNAAAHLRRAHFCPRKRGRRAKGQEVRERRAGKAGGDWPKIEWLKKEGWLKEVVVDERQRELVAGESHVDDAEVSTPTDGFEVMKTDSARMHHPEPATYLPSHHEAFAAHPLALHSPFDGIAYTYDSNPALQSMHWPPQAVTGYHTAPMMQHTVSAPATYPGPAYHAHWQ
ncbi:unnamed protein product [Zymoseptoria tritici ST99CH_1A5]|uniref:DUF7896 domain-containing protein n=2 Tax=Zymoseptoria tritici TaxID=1047171 RepID=A0A2H1FMV8_ZYMTR|nr:unnamed protein product [Zymoseptoria tritici ST99CH_1E4]SMY20007.1 unnamed protein product [Zymoseptoria tritici ST99CH_1A5]